MTSIDILLHSLINLLEDIETPLVTKSVKSILARFIRTTKFAMAVQITCNK